MMRVLFIWFTLLVVQASIVTPITEAKPRVGKRFKKKAKKRGGAATSADAVQRSEKKNSVRVRVIEVAGDRAFLEPGSADGIRKGTSVVINGQRFRVLTATELNAVVRIDRTPLAVGDQGTVQVFDDDTHEEPNGPPEVTSLETFETQWPTDIEVPAESQHPVYVPIDSGENHGPNQIILSAGISTITPTSLGTKSIIRSEIRGRAHFEPVEDKPMRVDADFALQKWMGRDLAEGGRARSLLRVYQLELGYGNADTFGGALGRLRYAANTLGTLDGVRLQSKSMDGLTIAGFGGLTPDPMSGGVSTVATRFGVEAMYSRPDLKLAPLATLVAHGSMFDGSVDERRVNGSFYLFPGDARLGGFLEVQMFDKNNPWNAPSVDIAAGGLDASLRSGPYSLGVRADMRKPERSNWLASYFPQSWLCIAQPPATSTGNTTQADACSNFNAARYALTLDAGASYERVQLNAGMNVVQSAYGPQSDQLGGFLSTRLLRLFDAARLEASLQALQGTWLSNYVGRVGVGAELFDNAADVSVYYRPAIVKYRRVANETWHENAIGGQLWLALSPRLSLQAGAEMISGYDVSVLLLQSYITWRPL